MAATIDNGSDPRRPVGTSSRLRDEASQQVTIFVARWGRGIVENRAVLRGLIRDYCELYRQELGLLLKAFEDDIPALAASPPAGEDGLSWTRSLALQFAERRGLPYSEAFWVVATWTRALGVVPAGSVDPSDPGENSLPPAGTLEERLAGLLRDGEEAAAAGRAAEARQILYEALAQTERYPLVIGHKGAEILLRLCGMSAQQGYASEAKGLAARAQKAIQTRKHGDGAEAQPEVREELEKLNVTLDALEASLKSELSNAPLPLDNGAGQAHSQRWVPTLSILGVPAA